MLKRTLFLFFIFTTLLTSCAVTAPKHIPFKPPRDFFVKVFKELEITRCTKKPDKKTKKKKCETRKFVATGSGMMIKTPRGKEIVLTAGHVCETSKLKGEDKTHTYQWVEMIRVLDRNKKVHQSHPILITQVSEKEGTADLCSLYVPSLRYLSSKTNIRLSATKPSVGEDIYYLGAPLGIYHPPTALILKGVFSGKIDAVASLVSAPAAPGASGALILSTGGRVYGVLFAVHPGFQNGTIVTSWSKTRDFLIKTDLLLQEE